MHRDNRWSEERTRCSQMFQNPPGCSLFLCTFRFWWLFMKGWYVNLLSLSCFVFPNNRCTTSGSRIYCKPGKKRQVSDKQSPVSPARSNLFLLSFLCCQVHLCLSLCFDALLQSLWERNTDATQHLLHTNALAVVGGCHVFLHFLRVQQSWQMGVSISI